MFIYNLEDIAKKLQIDFQGITNKINHNGVKGTAREDLLKEYLKKLLPEKYSISSGVIIDSKQNQSKQQDFIIHDAFNCPSFFKTETNSILPIESVYATIEIKSTLDYKTLEQSIKNVESVRKLKKIKNKRIISNIYDNYYPLGFVFAYSSKITLEQMQKKLFELNKEIEYNNQISIICILDKGLIFNVNKYNMTEVTLIPQKDTLLARSDSNIENTLYSFYLFLIEYIDNINIQVPSLIEYAKESGSFQISMSIPHGLIPDDAIYVNNGFEYRYGDLMKVLELNKKYPNLFNGKMTYDEMFNYLKDDFSTITNLNQKSLKDKIEVNMYGYKFTNENFLKFKEYAKDYYTNKNYKEKFDNIVNEIYKNYIEKIKNNSKE